MTVSIRQIAVGHGPAVHQLSCPYECKVTDICAASLSSMTISSSARQKYCSNDNYDSCPLFLAKSLRKGQ